MVLLSIKYDLNCETMDELAGPGLDFVNPSGVSKCRCKDCIEGLRRLNYYIEVPLLHEWAHYLNLVLKPPTNFESVSKFWHLLARGEKNQGMVHT